MCVFCVGLSWLKNDRVLLCCLLFLQSLRICCCLFGGLSCLCCVVLLCVVAVWCFAVVRHVLFVCGLICVCVFLL